MGNWNATFEAKSVPTDSIMKWAVPRLYRHFEELGFTPEILVSQWFFTHFSYTLPLKLLMRLWDYTFLTGWPGMYRVAIAMLRIMEETMLACDLDRLANMMRNFRTSLFNVLPHGHLLDVIFEEVNNVVVTDAVLQQLQENFALEMISAAEVVMAAQEHEAKNEAAEGVTGEEAIARLEKFTLAISDSLDVDMKYLTSSRSSEGARSSSVGSKSLGALSGRSETNWLLRYGAKLEGSQAKEMLRIRDDLMAMEVQIDHDKRNIQEKIVHACEVCRQAEEDFESAKNITRKLEEKIAVLREWYQKCMNNSSMLSKAAAKEIQLHEETYGQVPMTLAEYHEAHTSPRVSRPRKNRKLQSRSFSVDAIFGNNGNRSTDSSPSQPISPRGSEGSVSTPYVLDEDSDSELEEIDLEVDISHNLSSCTPPQSPSSGQSSLETTSLKSVPLDSPSPPSTPTGPISHDRISEALHNEIARSTKTVENSSSAPMDREKDKASPSSASGTPSLISSLKNSTRQSFLEISDAFSSSLALFTGKADPISAADRDLMNRLSKLGNESQKCQRSVIIINRAMTVTESRLTDAYTWLNAATTSLDEASQWKKSLCGQLQLLVEETNSRRSQKLQFVVNNFLF